MDPLVAALLDDNRATNREDVDDVLEEYSSGWNQR
jgi:hypothetical protein